MGDNLDIRRLREALTDYYGAAVIVGLPLAMIDLVTVSDASPAELARIAVENGFDLRDFELEDD